MHKNSRHEMMRNLQRYLDVNEKNLIVDIGSRDMAAHGMGTYKYLIKDHEYSVSSCWDYIGVDLDPGFNVDVVMPSPYEIPLADNTADAVISGQCFEHVKNPFRLMKEIFRIVKPGGVVMVVAPFLCNEHRYPIDCWRYLPDGWDALFEESGLTTRATYFFIKDCWGIAHKPKASKHWPKEP
jgi:SAM-dependent methyltransferase